MTTAIEQELPAERRPGVTLVNRYAFPDDSPTSRLMHDLTLHLASSRPDLEVRVLSSNRYYKGSTDALPATERLGRIQIKRLWAPAATSSGMLMRALSYFAFYLQGFLALLWCLRRGEILVCMSDPPMFNVLATLAAKVRGARVVHWVQDLYPDVVQSAGFLSRSPLLPALRALRRLAYRASERLVVIGEGMRDRLLRDGSGCAIEIIPNWADGGSIQPRDRTDLPLAREWLPPSSFVVGYFGNLGFAHSFKTSLLTADRLREQTEIQFLWVGEGSRKQALLQEMAQLQLPNFRWQPPQPFERISEVLALADVHVVMLDAQYDEVLVPSKTYSALAAARPLLFLGKPESELARLVREFDIGIAVALDDVAGIAAAIRELANNPERCREMGARARQLFDSRFNRQHAMHRWETLFASLQPR